VQKVWQVWEDVRRGAVHFQQRNVPLPVNWLGQFAHGLCLPFHLARALFADRAQRRSYLKVCTLQVVAVLALALLFTGWGKKVVEPIAPKEPQASTRVVVYWAALFSALQLAQWIVIALSRDYHTALSREVSLLNGVAPEDEPLTPRIRLNMPWLRNKMKRRWRGLVVFFVGVPLLWVARVLPGGKTVFTVLLSAWGAWWFVVFTAGKSARAWDELAPREPWFLRGWSWLTASIAPLRWALFGMYSSLWTTFTRPVFAPVACVERQPWVFSGLAVARALAVLPLVKCFLRPLIPVAAAHLMAQGAAAGEGDVRSVEAPGLAAAVLVEVPAHPGPAQKKSD
jgi:hypothetical protein